MMAVKPQHVILYLETYMDLEYKILLSNHNLFLLSKQRLFFTSRRREFDRSEYLFNPTLLYIINSPGH